METGTELMTLRYKLTRSVCVSVHAHALCTSKLIY